jgi:hypothetical protein
LTRVGRWSRSRRWFFGLGGSILMPMSSFSTNESGQFSEMFPSFLKTFDDFVEETLECVDLLFVKPLPSALLTMRVRR